MEEITKIADIQTMTDILHHFSQNDKQKTEMIINYLINSAIKSESFELWRNLVISYSLSLLDDYHHYRIEFTLQKLINLYDQCILKDIPSFAGMIAKIVATIYAISPIAQDWLDLRPQYKALLS